MIVIGKTLLHSFDQSTAYQIWYTCSSNHAYILYVLIVLFPLIFPIPPPQTTVIFSTFTEKTVLDSILIKVSMDGDITPRY